MHSGVWVRGECARVHTNLGALLDERDAQVRIALLDADGSSEARRTAADDDDIGLVDIARCIEQLALLVGQLNRGRGSTTWYHTAHTRGTDGTGE